MAGMAGLEARGPRRRFVGFDLGWRVRWLLLLVVFSLPLAFGASAQAAAPPPVLYGAVGGNNATSQLYSIDPTTGAGTPIGDIGNAVTGLAEDPTTGILYGVTSNNATDPRMLVTVNKATGAGTIVGPLGAIIADISFNSSGQLFGWSESVDGLASIDKATGAATPVGATGLDTYGDGESFDKNDVLYDMSNGDGTASFSSGALWTVDTSTSVPTTVATLSGSPYPPGTGAAIGAASFACDRTTLYAVANNFGVPPTFLITVNTATGAITTIGPTVTGLDALEWSCPQQIGFTASATSVNQSAGAATLSVTRTGGMKGAVSVNYATADGTAKAGTDYTAESGTLTFANNDQTPKTITVPITQEGADATEAFSVNLSSPTAGATLGISSQTVTINGIPGATTGPATNVGSSSATVTGSVIPNGVATTYHFDYGTTTQYGKSTASQNAGSGTSALAVSAHLSGLRPGAVYHYRLVAQSPSGTTLGADQTFSTKAEVSIAGLSGVRCARASSAVLRIHITSVLGTVSTVKLDSKTIARSHHKSLRVRLARLKLHAGRHTVTVTTKRGATTTKRTLRFRVCAAIVPKFTG